jgi:hypothetical protein
MGAPDKMNLGTGLRPFRFSERPDATQTGQSRVPKADIRGDAITASREDWTRFVVGSL